jgi:hypothetical protein
VLGGAGGAPVAHPAANIVAVLLHTVGMAPTANACVRRIRLFHKRSEHTSHRHILCVTVARVGSHCPRQTSDGVPSV